MDDDEVKILKSEDEDLTNEDCDDDYEEEYGEELELKDD
jgi:hypothetical protein